VTAISVFGGLYGVRLLLRGFPARIFPQADTSRPRARWRDRDWRARGVRTPARRSWRCRDSGPCGSRTGISGRGTRPASSASSSPRRATRPGCKWILVFQRGVRVQVMYPACCAAWMAAGPDEIRGQVPIKASRCMPACVATGSPVLGSTVSHQLRHHPCNASDSGVGRCRFLKLPLPSSWPRSPRRPALDRFRFGPAPTTRCAPSC